MNILVLGSGGREHAISWKLSQSDLCDALYIAPGNAGTDTVGENVLLNILDFEAIGAFCLDKNVKMVVVGPEEPLVKGIVDYFKSTPSLSGIYIIGPDKIGAQLEGSKDFAKAFMGRHNIPTARYKSFSAATNEEAKSFLRELAPPYVLKADGLAAGKGVIITSDLAEADSTIDDMLLGKKFGAASERLVIEEYLHGIEASVFVLSDGNSYTILPEAKDYKRIGEADQGLNTGGMGAVSPVPFADATFMKKVEDRVIIPTIEGLKKDGIKYVGFVFIGLMVVDGDPLVIEYNCRMGDPETEVVIPRIQSDLVSLLVAAAEAKLDTVQIEVTPQTATTVMMVSGGYPEDYAKGHEITGIDQVQDVLVFHAGTAIKEGKVVSNGGRVIALTAFGETMHDALAKSNKAATTIQWKDCYHRRDIGFDLKKYLVEQSKTV